MPDFFERSKNSGVDDPKSSDLKAGKQDSGTKAAKENGNDESAKKPPKVLLQWALGKDNQDDEDEDQETPLASDRPDFTEASVNVGAGRIQLEMGYTWIRDRAEGVTTERHSYPEALLRIGLWRDWLELRIGENLGTETVNGRAVRTTNSGAEDLYLGLGIGLTEQKGIFPQSRINLQARVPTGCNAFNDRHFLPGANYLYGWDVIEDKLSLGASTQINRKRDDTTRLYTEFAQSVTTGITITKKLSMYVEAFALFPSGADVAVPEYYTDSGFTYRVTNNLQFDIRAGMGLNRSADDFFAGSGVVVRY